jgi:hypothetical protein
MFVHDRGAHHEGHFHLFTTQLAPHKYIKGMHMQGLCVSKLFEHLPNAGKQKLHQNLRRQWCPSHVERHAHYCTQGFEKTK